MKDVLRELFGGGANGSGDRLLLASDWGNVGQIPSYGVSSDLRHAAALAAWSGLDNEMSPPPGGLITLVDSVRSGLIAESFIDRAAGNNLAEKFAAGLFDGAWRIPANASAGLDAPADRALAYASAVGGITLLKNDDGLLPLTGLGKGALTRVALLGPLGGCVPGERYPCLAEQGMCVLFCVVCRARRAHFGCC